MKNSFVFGTYLDYKLLKIVGFSESDDDSTYSCDGFKVDIYSLRSNSWRSITNTPYYVKNIVSYERGLAGLLVNGALHWIVYLEMENRHVIASFDIDDETFTELPKPKHFVEDEFRTTKVGLLGGRLCLLVGKCFSEGGGGDIWVMKNYGVVESWTLSFSICAQQVPIFQHFSSFRPVKCFKHAILFQQNDNILVLYDLNRKRARTIKVQGSRGKFSTEIYVGSLVSPSSFTLMS
ncbi:hypothetical protein MKW92_042234 [Papaver armeniacum]|nr:hypothetical protein MKW92_042234 [Papaver armeniacum]